MSEYKPIIYTAILAGLMVVLFFGYSIMRPTDETVIISQPVSAIDPQPEQVVKDDPESEIFPVEVNFQNRPNAIVEKGNMIKNESEPFLFVLPLLDDSDQLIRDGVVSLTRNERINFWLSPAELIRKFVVFVDNIAKGKVAREAILVIAPSDPFSVTTISEKTFLLDPLSYERYDNFTGVITSIDARRAAEFYDLLQPLFQEAFEELGYPEQNFNSVVFRAIGQLLEAPVVKDPILLTRPVVMYEFLDPSLESLSILHKQMIRMGPNNTKALHLKLSEIAVELRSILEN